ncbi:nickel-responsive transcriptional regulator NikR [Paenibacillus pasadenensis]|uniref:Putative nickel-responsive regulator n=1 Tax=Paenibacillus pasadenensis TaxID=217090 RepID=A0A2N5N7H6_9BACL|nr:MULTISPECIES: nickel-responsive transcriptional regulator NikR [Paenibacillus]PLT46250.1 Nickel responsive regulator NikR [Paenibacillus pasadenensis]QGG56706.1 nickel-responsive transcriptional regulator NikR [Paenibacillus sp. B01]
MAEKEELVRFGVAFPAPLIERFDGYIEAKGYTNRSEAIRDMARKAMLEDEGIAPETAVAGTISLVYDHHVRELPLLLTELQHDYHEEIISTMHVHLTHHQCMEIILIRGRVERLRRLHGAIQAQKGVQVAEMSVTFLE